VPGADLLVESLLSSGVDTLFGVPGDTGVVFYDALYSAQGRIRHVLARDERHAAVMADAFARVTNRVGAVEVSSGGGTTYAVGGLGEAYAASVPVLLITSDIHRRSRGTGALTEIDQLALFGAVTKWARVVESAADIPASVAEALRHATGGRPAPVALIFPENVFDEAVSLSQLEPRSAEVPVERRSSEVPLERPAADAAAVRAAVDALVQADRPALVAGSGVHLSRAWDVLAALAEQAALPVATTIHGKGSIPDASPWSLGVTGGNGGRGYANEYLRSADAVIFVGTRANATDTNGWTSPPRDGAAKIFRVDIDAGRAKGNFPGCVPLCGDSRTVLGQLLEAHPGVTEESMGRRRHWIETEQATWRKAQARDAGRRDISGVLPAEIIAAAHDILGPDTLAVADPGTPTPNLACFWETAHAGRSVLSPRGHGPMGYAIPASVGMACARPGAQVVAFTGDGSFAMSCGELETVARLSLPVLFIQMTNGSLGWIKMLQHRYTGSRYFGVDLGPIDSVAVAKACGIDALRAGKLPDVRQAITEFSKSSRPMYIDVPVPDLAQVTPPVAPWLDGPDARGPRPVY
jgi:acetolactate synthase I/II/III large subunit